MGIKEGMIVRYAADWCSPGEEKYLHIVKENRLNADYISIENPMKPIYLKNTATDEEGLVLPVRINQD